MQQEIMNENNKMGTKPIGGLLIKMASPMIFSMLVMALYNIVDSIFVAKISENALAAVSYAFPIQNLMIAVSVGIGVGANALISRSLGEKNFDRANLAAGNCITLSFFASFIFVIFGFFACKPFFSMQTDIQEIIDYGNDYLSIISIFSFSIFGQIAFEKLLASTGKTYLSMIMQLVGAVTNIILDPLLIFGLAGFPKMGVKGAAIATVVGQFLAFAVAVILNRLYNKELKIKVASLKLQPKIVKMIFVIGLPSILMVSISSIMVLGLNGIIDDLSKSAVPFLGVYIKLQSFVFMPLFGLSNGMVPIVSYNFGAQKPDRIKATIKLSVKLAFLIMIIGFVICQIIPKQLLLLFEASEVMLSIGIPGLRILSITFMFAGINIILSSACMALGKSFYSFAMSLIRQLIILLPVAWALSFTNKIGAVWWAFVIAELCGTLICIFMMMRIKKLIYKKPIIEMANEYNQN